MVNRVLQATDDAERRMGRPPTGIEIFTVFDELKMNNFAMPITCCYQICGILMSLLREGLLYCDPVGYRFTRH
jgi:hypothetical protein